MLVWVDETGCVKRDLLRKYGYSFRGMRAECKRLLVHGTRISAIAMCWDKGILDVEMTTNSVNGEMFCDFVRGSLIPNMLPFDGVTPTFIVVMDNCSIHHVADVKSLLEDAGILLIHLPPYSPDLNPIEEAFGYVKGYLKKHDDIAAAFPNPRPLIQSAFDVGHGLIIPNISNCYLKQTIGCVNSNIATLLFMYFANQIAKIKTF